MNRTRRRILGVAASLTAAAIASGSSWIEPTRAVAQATAETQAASLTLAVSASADSSSKTLLGALRAHPWFVANAKRIRMVEIPGDPKLASRPGIAEVAVNVYRQSPTGLSRVAGRSGFSGANDVALWISDLETPEPAPIRDPNLIQTGGDQPYPAASQQNYSVPASVPQAPVAPQQMVPMGMMVPQAMAPAGVIQAPAQSYIIQQSQPQFIFAQQAPAAMMVPQAMAPASMAPANIFTPSAMAPAAMAPAGMQPMMMVAPASMPATMAVASAPMVPMATNALAATGPVLSGAALSTSSVSVPASSTRSRVRVRGPGPLASAAARFGERLTALGRTRIETIQETNLENQVNQTPPGQVMTLTSTSASPVMAPQSLPVALPPQVAPPQAPTPQAPQASPQATTKSGHWH